MIDRGIYRRLALFLLSWRRYPQLSVADVGHRLRINIQDLRNLRRRITKMQTIQ
jgi:hypothetical protein